MRWWHGYLSGARCRWLACGPADALRPHHFCFSEIQNGLSFWYLLTWVVPDKSRKMVVVVEWTACLEYLLISPCLLLIQLLTEFQFTHYCSLSCRMTVHFWQSVWDIFAARAMLCAVYAMALWVMRFWHGYLSGAGCKWLAYSPADAIAIPSSLLQQNPEELSIWYQLK